MHIMHNIIQRYRVLQVNIRLRKSVTAVQGDSSIIEYDFNAISPFIVIDYMLYHGCVL